MDKMVEELEKDVGDVDLISKMNPIFAQNPYMSAAGKKEERQGTAPAIVQAQTEGLGGRPSVVMRRGNSTRYSNFCTEE